MRTVKFSEVPINSLFRETGFDPDVGLKTSETTAIFDYCAIGFCVEIDGNELVEVLL